MRWTSMLALGLLAVPQPTTADYFEVEFEGLPLKKVEMSFTATYEEPLDEDKRLSTKCGSLSGAASIIGLTAT